ncbi:MAG: hypothetical protein H7256_15425 [Bdellovibrio sp.]|nr:hypothetical protein [Bdellovibrio sp.]
MINVEEKDLEKAFLIWYRHFNFKNSDQEIIPFLKSEATLFHPEQIGWLEKARTGLFLSTHFMAKALDISSAAYSKFEQREKDGSISLKNLALAAEAMDCELVYAIRPKQRTNFSSVIWKILVHAVVRHPSLRSYDKNHRAKSVAAIATKLMKNPEFKKNRNWSQRANQKTE